MLLIIIALSDSNYNDVKLNEFVYLYKARQFILIARLVTVHTVGPIYIECRECDARQLT